MAGASSTDSIEPSAARLRLAPEIVKHTSVSSAPAGTWSVWVDPAGSKR
jgi:hypothetical protein